MKFSVVGLISAFTIASAQRTFNITEAFKPGNWEKYRCLDTETWLRDFEIPSCLHGCTKEANRKDGCAYDDFACHSINYQAYSDLIEPCAFPPQLGGHGSCTLAELRAVRPKITASINFFNATVYAAYTNCNRRSLKLNPLKTMSILANEPTIISFKG